MPPWTEHTSLREANDELTRVILEAAEAAIPRGARKTPKPWWNEEVDAAVRRRNQLRGLARTDPGQGAAWREAEREVRRLIVEARRASWRDFTSQLSLRTDARKVWDTMKALDGKGAPMRQDEELRVGAKSYSSDKSKADAFMRVGFPATPGLPGNELADEIAREAANLEQHDVPIDLPSAKARLRRHAHREWEQRLQPTRYALQNGMRGEGYLERNEPEIKEALGDPTKLVELLRRLGRL
ncbi:hypothetical protein FJT64_010208 [Amphibalanus amphitrite]|uniref:RNase H type-1 domain-containing protein n=1 Tax=Amphibalanus amphitrite TaxID=1232801 RepID=A0A6A4V650_AMPAM|nr:hypothetical protein FJT64_010208 [Amphibalanus amphitrite]